MKRSLKRTERTKISRTWNRRPVQTFTVHTKAFRYYFVNHARKIFDIVTFDGLIYAFVQSSPLLGHVV